MSNDLRKNVHGEGNYEAAREYQKNQKKFQEENDVEKLGKKAKEAVENDDGELAEAEKKGKAGKKVS